MSIDKLIPSNSFLDDRLKELTPQEFNLSVPWMHRRIHRKLGAQISQEVGHFSSFIHSLLD
jgi:hypothetical protein